MLENLPKNTEIPKLPAKVNVQDFLAQAYEELAPYAIKRVMDLMGSGKDEVALKAAIEVLNRVGPEKFSNDFDYLKNKSKEELIGIIEGSGILEQLLKNKENHGRRITEAEIIEPEQSGIGGVGPNDVASPSEG